MSDIEKVIVLWFCRQKSDENLSLDDKTANLGRRKNLADWTESAQDTLLNKEKFLKAPFKEEVCRLGASFRQLDSI